ncbi:MAG: transposase [Chloroflexi bacterium]|nr:transposase [Chloroflexota bacterium]
MLKAAGRIPQRCSDYHSVVRPEPLRHWEMDFAELGSQVEFLSTVDRGTSILISTAAAEHYNAETALLAVAQLLLTTGLPEQLRFDNDTRFVGNWLADGFPSPLMRFLLCLGVEPDLVEPGKPYHKPFVERSIRTLKYECLLLERPEDAWEAADKLDDYRQFYNHRRANQSSACGNRPPYEAFPELPTLPQVPETVDPDAWLTHYHGRVFKRRVGLNGTISVGNHDYYVDYLLKGEPVGVLLEAAAHQFAILHKQAVVQRLDIQGLVGHPMLFGDYLRLMLAEARTLPAA